MLKKIISFFDRHRIILVIFILLIVTTTFIGIHSIIFLQHNFTALNCTKDSDEVYCYHDNIKILKDPVSYTEKFFKNNKSEINKLKKNYKLAEFNFYTAYYYEVASSIYNNEELYEFFKAYSNTYNLEEFYIKNNLYFELFYNYKLPVKEEEKPKNSLYQNNRAY